MLTYPVRTCAGCSGFFLAWEPPSGTHANPEPYYCPTCSAKRPWRAPTVGALVTLYGKSQSRYVVLALDGDSATVRQLGFPDAPSFAVHVLSTLTDA